MIIYYKRCVLTKTEYITESYICFRISEENIRVIVGTKSERLVK